jgi:hypothetical protein
MTLHLWTGDLLAYLTGRPNFVKHPIYPTLLSYDGISRAVSGCYDFRRGGEDVFRALAVSTPYSINGTNMKIDESCVGSI